MDGHKYHSAVGLRKIFYTTFKKNLNNVMNNTSMNINTNTGRSIDSKKQE